jgi:hypothetical protein
MTEIFSYNKMISQSPESILPSVHFINSRANATKQQVKRTK